ncbi:ABC-2 transporter permease [Aeromicrobium terrae]|uniref:ABC transporter permease n=1 Tax=Aeromicrobium terrae TaxID=2498846 RepID=A0A5C8NEU7_9ACTN|nr:ABC transporter permease [Aeromicrobium terrae]TXL58087.1 ABC transporter permease [Aeromicrobium terrae]
MSTLTVPRPTTIAPIPTSSLLGVEARKMFDTRSGFWLMASIGIAAVLATAATIIFAPDDELTYNSFAAAVGFPMTVILPMIAALAVSSEWSQRSALTTFTLVPSRTRVLGAKAAVTVMIGVAGMVVAMAIGALGNVIGSSIAGVDLTWDITVSQFLQIVLANQIGMAMGFMLGLLFRSSPGAIVGYFVYALVLPGASGALASAQQWWNDNGAWFDHNWAVTRLYDNTLTGEMWAQIGVTTVIWLVLPFLLAWRLMLRSEVK